MACLSWVKEFWTNCEGGYGVALVDDVAACVRHLVASFDNFIKTHRRAHSLTGTHLSQEAKDAYAQWVSSRTALVSPPPPHGTVYESEWESLVAESTQFPRLRITEESVRSWYTGIVAFRQDLDDLVQEALDDSEVGEAIGQFLRSHIECFPMKPRV
ncbi:unnamed protein product [Penicillium camemberti]|uniref:Str. FM013 n=1 Tax=Penicillium camemberti (strain FM 013) TaxID=1429867 RepID=A0A0G4PA97_PENC3|nr:unnamed protein product [Penicillium camemberti]